MPTEELEHELRSAFAKAAADLQRPEYARQRLLRHDYRPAGSRRRAMRFGLGGLSAAAIVTAVVLAVTTLVPSGHPASHPATAKLAAWTVVKQTHGTIKIIIREFRDPAGLQRRLRADGVPASVIFHQAKFPDGVPFRDLFRVAHNPCRPGAQGPLLKVIPPQHPLPPLQGSSTILLRPSALPSNEGVQFIATTNVLANRPGRHALGVWLVQATHQCTGT